MRRLALVVAISALGCGQMVLGGGGPGRPSYPLAVAVHNQDLKYPETLTCSWWCGSSIVGSRTLTAPPGGDAVFVLCAPRRPDGFELDGSAWPAQSGGNAFGSPDYAGADVFHVYFPTGFTVRQP